MKKKIAALLIVLFFSSPLSASVYKHVDANGNVTYSNIPSDNAKQIDLPSLIVVPAIDHGNVEERMIKRRESLKLEKQREKLQGKISEAEKRLNEAKDEYKDGTPDRLGSERNYQRYLDRVERLKEEIKVREKNLNSLREEMNQLPEKIRLR